MKKRIIYLLFCLLTVPNLSGVMYGQERKTDRSQAGQSGIITQVYRKESAITGQETEGQENSIYDRTRTRTCSLGTLRGSYGYLMKGTNLNWLQLPAGPTAIVGTAIYDGAGKVTTTATSVVNGLVVPVSQQGTYTVNEDCTGEVVFPLGVFHILITSDGREIRGIQGYPPGVVLPPGAGWVIDAVAKKIAPPSLETGTAFDRARGFYCNPGNVAGHYIVQASGTVLNAPPLPPGPMSGLSRLVLSDSGQSSVKFTFNFNGMIVTGNDTATGIELNPDCTSTARQTSNGAIQKIVFVNGGTEFFFLQLPPEGSPNLPGIGAVLSGEGRRIHQ